MPLWLSCSGIGLTLAITAVQDVRRRKVAGAVIFGSTIVALSLSGLYGWSGFIEALVGLGVAAAVGIMWAVVLPCVRRGWSGVGDALLFLPIGAWCGWSVFLWGALLGCVAMAPLALVLRRQRIKSAPFAPALLVGVAMAQLLALT
jgi:prepilin signal peptidase PulO-like enzyme (type II secretory pathway)